LGALPAGELGYSSLDVMLVPPFNGGATDSVGRGQLALANAPVMGFEHFQPEAFCGLQTRPQVAKGMSEVAIALGAVVLGDLQMDHHQLITLPCVFDGTLISSLDAHRAMLAIEASWPGRRLGPDVNIAPPFDPLNDRTGQAQDRMILGYRNYLH